MKAFEFPASVSPNCTLTVPAEVAAQLQKGQPVRVILLIQGDEEDVAWAQLTGEQFLNGYADGDAIYDNLPAG